MDKLIFISILIIIILLLLILKCYCYKDKFTNNINIGLTPSETKKLGEEFNKINKEKYLKYKEDKNNILKNTDFQIGYTKLEGTNEKTIGLCPLGSYFKGKFTGNPEDIVTKCKKCFQCNKYPGYLYKEGCLGDKDSVCEFKKLPHDLYIKAHTYPYTLHSHIPQHQHSYLNEEQEQTLSSEEHIHSL